MIRKESWDTRKDTEFANAELDGTECAKHLRTHDRETCCELPHLLEEKKLSVLRDQRPAFGHLVAVAVHLGDDLFTSMQSDGWAQAWSSRSAPSNDVILLMEEIRLTS